MHLVTDRNVNGRGSCPTRCIFSTVYMDILTTDGETRRTELEVPAVLWITRACFRSK
jgi:hypothetical protein